MMINIWHAGTTWTMQHLFFGHIYALKSAVKHYKRHKSVSWGKEEDVACNIHRCWASSINGLASPRLQLTTSEAQPFKMNKTYPLFLWKYEENRPKLFRGKCVNQTELDHTLRTAHGSFNQPCLSVCVLVYAAKGVPDGIWVQCHAACLLILQS